MSFGKEKESANSMWLNTAQLFEETNKKQTKQNNETWEFLFSQSLYFSKTTETKPNGFFL